jgi:predicted nuclease with TOPRIM domain
MKWKNELQQCGLTEETISHGLRNKIKDYYQMVEGINELKDSIENPSINDDVEELQTELEDLQDDLLTFDNNLVRAIQVFDKNKERYAQLSKNIGKGRPRKDGQPAQVKQNQIAEPNVVTKPTLQVQTQTGSTQINTKETEEKKKTNWWLFAGAVVLAGVTFGLYKMKD